MSRRGRPLRLRGTYTHWSWAEQGFSSLEHTLVPEIDPGPDSTYFWAHQFRTERGEGGYIGLQTKGNRVDGSLGKMAIFSFWDALAAEGPAFQPFAGEGEGWSCRIPFLWEAGGAYRLRLEMTDEDPAVICWGATVDGQLLGRIRVPARWGRMGSWSVMWTEFYGPPITRCEDLPHSRARFSTPVADGGVRPHRSEDRIADGDCDTSRITRLGDDVRHEMGLRQPSQPRPWPLRRRSPGG